MLARNMHRKECLIKRTSNTMTSPNPTPVDWRRAPPDALIDHILSRYHARHRDQLDSLVDLARKVERVHGAHAECPRGLADHLAVFQQELESHMQKEEQVLFPMLARGRSPMVRGPIAVMRMEHEQHLDALRELDAISRGNRLPEDACRTWRALHDGIEAFRDDLVHHIALENEILFQGATNDIEAGESHRG